MIKIICILIIAGIIAGTISTIAGLASLVAYPTLLYLGLPPITADVTQTLAQIFTGVGATIASQKELKGNYKELFRIAPLTLIGCIIGSLLLFIIPSKTFQKIVPFFILIAGILVLIPRKDHNQLTANNTPSHQKNILTILAWLGVFLVGIYCGYFGAASGVVMIALLSFISKTSFQEYNAIKNVTMGLANLLAAFIYITKTHIHWLFVIPLGTGFLIGGIIGPHLVRILPIKIIKIIIAILAVILAISLFKTAYHL